MMEDKYKASHDYTSNKNHVLSFRKGTIFTVIDKVSNSWWSVCMDNGCTGLVPSTYLEPFAEDNIAFKAKYDYAGQDPQQLSFKKGDKLNLIEKVNKHWWNMLTVTGKKGLVPVCYMEEIPVGTPPDPSTQDNSLKSTTDASEVLQSIDNAIQQIYDESLLSGGVLTEQQRAIMSKLNTHRQQVLNKESESSDARKPEKKKPSRKAPPPPTVSTLSPTESTTHDIVSRDEVAGDDNEVAGDDNEIAGDDNEVAGDDNEVAGDDNEVAGDDIDDDDKKETDFEDKVSSPVQLALPTSFESSVGIRLVNAVRTQTGVSFTQSLATAVATLQFVREEVPALETVMDAIIISLHSSEAIDTELKVAESDDLQRLRFLFERITECRDDRQERSWAVRDDQGYIMEYLEELLKLLNDADPDVCKAAVQENNYENILVLVDYYQMEMRWPIRFLLLQTFGLLFTLDPPVIGVCMNTVLPNVLGKDIQDSRLSKALKNILYVSQTCTMLFSTGELVPLSVYDQWSADFIFELLDLIEEQLEWDPDEQVQDLLVNVLLSFNQHFPESQENFVMEAIKRNPHHKVFGEKLMLLINREEDPVALKEPQVPDSMTKFFIDLYSDKSTSELLYTSDLKVLLDIISRQLSDRGPDDKIRYYYLHLLYHILGSTDYGDMLHRQDTLRTCLNRIFLEEDVVNTNDKEEVSKIWDTFPQYFLQSSNV